MARWMGAAVAVVLTACIEPAPGAGWRPRSEPGPPPPGVLAPSVRPQHEGGAVFGGAIELAGYDLDPPALVPGRTAVLTLYWRSVQPLDESYEVFVHLDARGGGRLHGDHWPAEGAYTTERWRPGDLVRDPVRIPVPAGYHAEVVDAWIGWYSGEERLPVTSAGDTNRDREDRLLLGEFPVAR